MEVFGHSVQGRGRSIFHVAPGKNYQPRSVQCWFVHRAERSGAHPANTGAAACRRQQISLYRNVTRGRPLSQAVPSPKTVHRTVFEFTPCRGILMLRISLSAESESVGLLRKSPPDTPENVVVVFGNILRTAIGAVTSQLICPCEIGSAGAGVRWTPLPKAEAPTEPTGETSAPARVQFWFVHRAERSGAHPANRGPASRWPAVRRERSGRRNRLLQSSIRRQSRR